LTRGWRWAWGRRRRTGSVASGACCGISVGAGRQRIEAVVLRMAMSMRHEMGNEVRREQWVVSALMGDNRRSAWARYARSDGSCHGRLQHAVRIGGSRSERRLPRRGRHGVKSWTLSGRCVSTHDQNVAVRWYRGGGARHAGGAFGWWARPKQRQAALLTWAGPDFLLQRFSK
jgi:hypothetical protein